MNKKEFEIYSLGYYDACKYIFSILSINELIRLRDSKLLNSKNKLKEGQMFFIVFISMISGMSVFIWYPHVNIYFNIIAPFILGYIIIYEEKKK